MQVVRAGYWSASSHIRNAEDRTLRLLEADVASRLPAGPTGVPLIVFELETSPSKTQLCRLRVAMPAGEFLEDNPGSTFEKLARLGYGARGLVYCLVGGIALLAAIGWGGQTGGSRSALTTLLDQPFGRAILAVIGLGLAGLRHGGS